jgi:hypothetical protein
MRCRERSAPHDAWNLDARRPGIIIASPGDVCFRRLGERVSSSVKVNLEPFGREKTLWLALNN